MAPTLKECLDRHGSDKATRHQYHRVYEPILSPLRDRPLYLLEVGVWRGASLRAWREWFPLAFVFGLDTYTREQMRPIPGVEQIQADSTNPPDLGMFDVIIDDGCHFPRVQAQTLAALWPMLVLGGLYFIEDVWKPDPDHPWTKRHSEEYRPENYAELDSTIESTGGKLEVYDQRDLSGELDSCIYLIRK